MKASFDLKTSYALRSINISQFHWYQQLSVTKSITRLIAVQKMYGDKLITALQGPLPVSSLAKRSRFLSVLQSILHKYHAQNVYLSKE